MNAESAINIIEMIRSYLTAGNPMWNVEVVSEACDKAIEALKQTEWIPVSERLPEDEGWYLITDCSGGSVWLEVEHYNPEFGLEPFCTVQNPVAWMPLPTAYKAGEEE